MAHALLRHAPLARLLFTAVAALLALAAPAQLAHGQTTISLRTAAQLPDPSQPLTLADVADISGDDAAKWAALVLAPRAADQPSITISTVRAALNTAGANFGRITLRGSVCGIALPQPASHPVPAAPAKPARQGPLYAVIDVSGQQTAAKAIARRLAAHYGVAPEDLQLAFDPADLVALGVNVPDRHVIEVKPAASPTSSRIPIRATIYSGDRVVAEHRATADVLLKRDVFIANRDIDRRETITDSDIRPERRWLAPGAARSSSPPRESIVNATARARIKEGDLIASSDVEAPLVIRRGDVVYVHCLSGSIAVQARARALAAGREGELIAFRMEGADESFTARIAGPGRAVMVAGIDSPAAGAEQ